jgi:hypothetical protein
MNASVFGLLGLALSLVLLLFFQRRLQQEFQILFYLITRRADLALILFSVLFFPGVLLHEFSHYLTAKILGIKTGRFSLIPRPLPDGKLQMGYVETASSDWFRDALVGAAPLIVGGAIVAYISIAKLKIPDFAVGVWNAGVGPAAAVAKILLSQPDVWLWIYLALVISSTMIPSASDRRVWLPLGLFMFILVAASVLMGAGPWLLKNLAPAFNRFINAIVFVFGISILLHMLLLPPVWLCRKVLSRLMGLDEVL